MRCLFLKVCMFSLVSIACLAYEEPAQPDKIYLNPLDLLIEKEAIFLDIGGVLMSVNDISRDEHGYYTTSATAQCPNGHPWSRAYGGCMVPGCPYSSPFYDSRETAIGSR